MTLMLRIQSTLHCLRMHRQQVLCRFRFHVLCHPEQHQRVTDSQSLMMSIKAVLANLEELPDMPNVMSVACRSYERCLFPHSCRCMSKRVFPKCKHMAVNTQ